jgi:hypothetical protein
MEDAIAFAVEMNEWAWERVKRTLANVTPEEAEWRPLPQANNINLIIRHLRIEAKWQFEAIDRGVPMPAEVSESEQKIIDAIPLDDFAGNMRELEKSCLGFIEALRSTTLAVLEKQGEPAYKEYRTAGATPSRHQLGFHHAMHLIGHMSQISTIRNLYRKTHGERALFFPDNPTYPA